ncbi:TlpA family protein disulfide reductase [Blastopirellula sp. JC732]|uniref:TlpA family protein disulfide reductase n=1 Tax=Blastopirellula sediminis TaxID=2894196 RepID=A0A9X1MQ70_9BACT|nr:TlpA disulfide reductase family protein [Blastopirellula sediminis]MCC9605372.1 TlpA family protein disulfide reductase [Blastopirellula sediminis]MCC9631328.1 TlpA family protein disulfide reductase [Blastopirellula sediminis]
MTQSDEHHLGPERSGEKWISTAVTAILFAVLIGLCVILVIRAMQPPPQQSHPWVGQQLSAVEFLPLLNTEQTITAASLQGKVTLINYWGPWCPPCLAELPGLVRLSRDLKEEAEFQFIPVSCSRDSLGGRENMTELAGDSADILQRINVIGLPVYADATGVSRTELNSFASFAAYPTTILVDRNGVIQRVWVGAYDMDVFRDAVELELSKG